MANTTLEKPVYFTEDEANRLDAVICKLRLMIDLLVDRNQHEFTDEHFLGLASLLNDSYEELHDIKGHLKTLSKQ